VGGAQAKVGDAAATGRSTAIAAANRVERVEILEDERGRKNRLHGLQISGGSQDIDVFRPYMVDQVADKHRQHGRMREL
jgi:hypothetical protein